ncbi:MAG: hypothetical protein RLZZ450_1954 [Pseudomonadota bacterium]|jgi:hypothetical protein
MDDQIKQLDFKAELAALATLRDELKLKVHLARADLNSQLDDLERRWLLVEEQLRRTKDHVKQDTALVEHRLAQLLADLKLGYQNVKRAFESE